MVYLPLFTAAGTVSSPPGIAAIVVGSRHTCALTGKGGVNCWGQNSRGKIGNRATAESPVYTPWVWLGSAINRQNSQKDHSADGAHNEEGQAISHRHCADAHHRGCAYLCIEINFPALFIEYNQLGVDCLLLSAYPIDEIFYIKARAHAAVHNYWVGLSDSAECSHLMMSGLIGPDGMPLKGMNPDEGLVIDTMARDTPELDIALPKARPWRTSIGTNDLYKTRHLNDPRSVNRTCI